MVRVLFTSFIVLFASIISISCGGGKPELDVGLMEHPVQTGILTWPRALPVDALQPWEITSANGKVMAELGSGCEFAAGVERFQEGGDYTSKGDVLGLASGAPGDGWVSYAMYRISLGGAEPGAIGLDVNLRPVDGHLRGYYLGLSNYARGAWEWHGPFTDGREILSVVDGLYTSTLGNTFICIVAFDGVDLDVVGVTVAPRDGSDATAPMAPSMPVLTPVTGGLQVDWVNVDAGDLAGYRIYYSDETISETPGKDVNRIGYLEGRTQHLISGLTGKQHVRVSAVDISGNESALSPEAVATPLAGTAGEISVTVDVPCGLVGCAATLTATGADLYYLDLDGDGEYEVTDNTTGTALVDTGHIGIIRPAVMGITGEARACGAVSLLVSGNSRPVASAVAAPQYGTAPLEVTFTGIAEDLEDEAEELTYAWDFDGDGTFDDNTDTLAPDPYTYDTAGLFNAKFRVEDSDGSWDVDTVAVQVDAPPEPENNEPVAVLVIGTNEESGFAPHTVHFDAGGSSDPDAGDSIVRYWWDLNGDGMYEGTTDGPQYEYTFRSPGVFTSKLKVEDSSGATSVDSIEITVSVEGNNDPVADITADKTTDYIPMTITFDASGSTDSDGSIVQYEWDFDGDGSYEENSEMATATYTYMFASWYKAKVRVTDNAGAQDTAVIDITLPSEWPMFGGNARHTGLSLYVGAQTNNLKWEYMMMSHVYSSPVIGADGTIYAGCSNNRLYAVNPDGSFKWFCELNGEIYSAQAIGADGTIYIGNDDGRLYAINSDGSVKWAKIISKTRSSPAIGVDGTIFIGSDSDELYAIEPNGDYKWIYRADMDISSSPAIDPDGTVYVGVEDGKLCAINPDGCLKWSYSTGDDIYSSPAIGADGTVYIGSNDDNLYAINPDGSLKWQYATGANVRSTPAIAADGTIYVGNNNGLLFAINPDGSFKWSYYLGLYIYSAPAIGADGTIYLGSTGGSFNAINPDGSLKWSYNIGPTWSSAAIGADGTVYVASEFAKLYAFGPSI